MEATVAVATQRIGVEVGHATRTWDDRTAFTVRLMAGEHVGEGEVVPLASFSPDSPEDVARDLGRFHGLVVDVADGVPHAFDTCCASARFALSTAALDLAAKSRGLGVGAYLGGTAESVPLSKLLPSDDAGFGQALDAALASGISAFKVKIGADLGTEKARIARLLRRAPAATVRADANGALAHADVARVLGALADLGVLYVEEPVPLHTLPRAPRWPLPVALDESLPRLTRDARRMWLESGALGALILKPAILGGLDRALALAHVAAAHGVPSSASHALDGPIGLAAAAELALALPSALAAGVAPHEGLAAFSPRRIAALEGARVHRHARPGLGLS